MMTFQTECYPQSSSRHNSSTVPPDTSKRVSIDSSWAADSKYIIKILRKCLSKILERGSQKVETPLSPPPNDLLRLDSFIYQSISLNLRIPIINKKWGWHLTYNSYVNSTLLVCCGFMSE
jgi:hypothetical protein